MGSPTNDKPTQLLNVEPSLPTHTSLKNIENQNIYDLGLSENKKRVDSHRLDSNVDMKKLRRTISNRLSAQKSREKRVQYTLTLEKRIQEYQDYIQWILTPEIDRQKIKNKLLLTENEFLQKEIEKMTIEENLQKVKEKALRFEIQRFNELAIGNIQIPNSEPEPTVKRNQELAMEEDVDHYLNFDEVNLDDIDFV